MDRDAAVILARHIAATDYASIPEDIAESTKKSILDTLGVIAGASGIVPGCKKVVELVKEIGGSEESSILVFGGKVPAMMAAFANGSMSHALDYDNQHFGGPVHPTSPILPAGLAIAERIGKISGKEFITAITLGIDLIGRMAMAVSHREKHDWHPTPLFGTFGSAAVAGKLLGLNEDKLADALGIAFLQAAGSFQMDWSTGVDVTYHRDAFPGKAGVISALLAQRGITGIKDCLQSKDGLYNLYFKGDYNPSFLTDNLGKRFEGIDVGFKTMPLCGWTSGMYVTTILNTPGFDVPPKDIVEIIVSFKEKERGFFEPLEEKKRPADHMAASLSMPFIVAAAVTKRKAIDLSSFTPEALNDPETLEVAQKIVPKCDPKLFSHMPSPILPDRSIIIKTKDEELYSKKIDFPYGHPKNPLTINSLIKKFEDCVSYAARPIPKSNIERAVELILNLEKVDDISKVIQLFV